ncbi:hypothetical protein M3Y94_00732300 [Aphelenchoides besseyi]|nr:hypothetical protein M3Y94_00732300 [Aphelenchoides besseyi]
MNRFATFILDRTTRMSNRRIWSSLLPNRISTLRSPPKTTNQRSSWTIFLNTAVSDVDTAKSVESLDEFLLTAASDVETAMAVESLDQFVQTANSEVETAEELNLDDYVQTAESDVSTGLVNSENSDEFLNTATSEADTGVYGEVSDYEDHSEELDVEMNNSLYPQAYIPTLEMPNELRECYTPKPKDLSFADFL